MPYMGRMLNSVHHHMPVNTKILYPQHLRHGTTKIHRGKDRSGVQMYN